MEQRPATPEGRESSTRLQDSVILSTATDKMQLKIPQEQQIISPSFTELLSILITGTELVLKREKLKDR